MKTEPELIAAANENFLASFRKVVEHSPEGEARWFGAVFAFVSGLPISLFNGCVVVEAVDADELDAALGWLRTRDLPHRAFISAELVAGLIGVVLEHGLERDPHPYPGMVLHPIPEPPQPPADVTVVRGGRLAAGRVSAGLRRDRPAAARCARSVLAVVRRRPRCPALCRAARGTTRREVTCDQERGRQWRLRRRNARERASAWGRWCSDLGRDSRGAGVGRDAVALQSSQMGLSLYAALGFRFVAPYMTFTAPVAGTRDRSSVSRSSP